MSLPTSAPVASTPAPTSSSTPAPTSSSTPAPTSSSTPAPTSSPRAPEHKRGRGRDEDAEAPPAKAPRTEIPDLFDDPHANEGVILRTSDGPIQYTKRPLIQHSPVLRAKHERNPAAIEWIMPNYSTAAVQSLVRILETNTPPASYKVAGVFVPCDAATILLTFKLAHQWDIQRALDYAGAVIVGLDTIYIDMLDALRRAHSPFFGSALEKFIAMNKEAPDTFPRCLEGDIEAEPILAALIKIKALSVVDSQNLCRLKTLAREVLLAHARVYTKAALLPEDIALISALALM